MLLLKGQKVDITRGTSLSNLSLQFGWSSSVAAMNIDAACFMLSDSNRCERDEDFIFYGNSSAQSGAVNHKPLDGIDKEAISIFLSKLPNSVAKMAFTLTIHEGEKHGHRMKDISNSYLRLVNADNGEEIFRFEYGSDLSKETAIVVGELYRHNGEWKFNEKTILSSIDLRKKIVQITLEKKKLTNFTARVGLVLDISGSMQTLYKNGTVQEVVERILAVACKFDDNATLDVWIYDNEFSRLPSATEEDFDQYVQKHIMNNKTIHKFGRNNEPPVMQDVIHKYTIEEDSSIPVFMVFINDGGVVKPIKKVITESAVQPIFWQFVGIGDSDFDVLKQLDTMEGRIVDNANFIHIEDIASISDETLYNHLLNEFPLWLKEAAAKRIIRI
ncbi:MULTISPECIES: VWA domain-containing protein [unclassified Paenibacillus]|uniref:VWA domain-containing protein n=1 Tax=unclassified Paenibacillus TaxID=185978 RepID=UPI0009E69A4D|nr:MULTISPECIES: VWA domain-containing protein [unclassified Paenibacillus]